MSGLIKGWKSKAKTIPEAYVLYIIFVYVHLSLYMDPELLHFLRSTPKILQSCIHLASHEGPDPRFWVRVQRVPQEKM